MNVERQAQLIWLGIQQKLSKLTESQLQLTTLFEECDFLEFDSVVTDLSVIVLDNQLSIGLQVTAVSIMRQLHVVQ